MSAEAACDEVIQRERQLLDPKVRNQPDRMRELLHPEFFEFGASGRIWNVDSIIDALTSEQTPHEITGTDFLAVPLAPDAILLTFKTVSAGRVCLRSSIWIRSENDQWLLRFHQGTVIFE